MGIQSLDIIMVAPRDDMAKVMTPDGIEYAIRGGFVKVHPAHVRHFVGHGFKEWHPGPAVDVGPKPVPVDAKPAEDLAESPVREKARADAAELLAVEAEMKSAQAKGAPKK